MNLQNRIKALRLKGYVGPRYAGVTGRVRLLAQGHFGHREIVSYAERTWWVRPELPNPNVMIKVAKSTEEAEPFVGEMSRAYFRDFVAEWRSYFESGQYVVLAFHEGRLAAVLWVQDGARGAKCHFLRLQSGEVRLFRGGVLPAFRSKKIHATRHILALEALFDAGVQRVYVEAFEDNLYTWHGHRRAGYREFGRIHVKRQIDGKQYVRWL